MFRFTSVSSVSAIALALALAACSPAESPAPETAAAETAETTAPAIAESADVKPFTVGDLQGAALKDNDFYPPNDNSVLAIHQTHAEVDPVLEAAGLDTDKLHLSVQPMLIETADKVFLFDTGTGPGGSGKATASLEAAGVAPADVDDIFISHYHFDHVGGLLTAEGALAFPNATIHISAPEWAFMQSSEDQAALVAAIADKVETFEPGAEIVPGAVQAVEIKGHTPGHTGFMVTSGDASLLYIGDAMHHSVISVQEPDWTIAYDSEPETAQESRKIVLAEAADSGQRVYAVHFPFPGLGKFERKDDGFVWVAE